MKALFYVDGNGFVRRDWRREREGRQSTQNQPSFLQTVVNKTLKRIWRPISQVFGVFGAQYKNSRPLQIKAFEDQITNQLDQTRECTEKFIKVKLEVSNDIDREKSVSEFSVETVKIVPSIEQSRLSLRQLSKLKADDKPQNRSFALKKCQNMSSVQSFVMEEDVFYNMTKIGSTDVYEITVNRHKRQILNHNMEPIQFNFELQVAAKTIMDAIDKKEALRIESIHKTKQQIIQSMRQKSVNNIDRQLEINQKSNLGCLNSNSNYQSLNSNPNYQPSESFNKKRTMEVDNQVSIINTTIDAPSHHQPQPVKAGWSLGLFQVPNNPSPNNHSSNNLNVQLMQSMQPGNTNLPQLHLFSQATSTTSSTSTIIQNNTSIFDIDSANNPFINQPSTTSRDRKPHRSMSSSGRNRRLCERPA